PLFAPELRDIGSTFVEFAQDAGKQSDVPNTFLPVVDELGKGFLRSVKKGDLDGAIAVVGPDKNGKFTVGGAVSFDDTAELDKAQRKAAKPPELAKLFEFDVAKVGEVGIHKVPLTRLFREEALREIEKVFGENPPAYM